MLDSVKAKAEARPMELLAPAGDKACLEAALEAGADAVYLGLTTLNARRHARNFSELELARACEQIHALGRRVYLTLNIDLAQDELSRAARMLELASSLKVDAVLVRDPALLALRPCFPELEYHLSTQACIASSADVEAARDLGARRVVLARELSLAEIAAASKVEGIETEIFAHGALCFCVSGRCLLSSWVGGRSGNRGQCTGPCRVPWMLDRKPGGTPFSMHDLSFVTRIEELRAAGVRALKIEGRMKNPSWVRAAVALMRKAIDQPVSREELAREASRRGATPGRKITSAYLDGRLDELIEPALPEADEEQGGAADAKPSEPGIREAAAALLREVDAPVSSSPGLAPDRVRLSADRASELVGRIRPAGGAIVEGLDAAKLRCLVGDHPQQRFIAALPSVFFEAQRPAVEALIAAACELGVTVEANNWGGLMLARRAGARIVAGPGLGILNALAARELARLGAEEVTASIEADALKLEALLCRLRLPCSVVVFGRPALMVTRVELPPAVASAELEDRRAARLRARREGPLWALRPVQPFDLRAMRLPAATAHAVVDLIGSSEPLLEWEKRVDGAPRFNFERVLS